MSDPTQTQKGTQQDPPAGEQPNQPAAAQTQPEESCADALRKDYHGYNPFARFLLWATLGATALYMGYAGCRNATYRDQNAQQKVEQKAPSPLEQKVQDADQQHNVPAHAHGSEIR